MLLAAEVENAMIAARDAQAQWALVPVRRRLTVIRRLRHEIASGAEALAATVPLRLAGSLHRSLADTLVAEVLPLLEACRFLEREAEFALAPRRESSTARPLWLGGVTVETRRDPLGLVLIIGPGNYPLYLPGVQALQALVAGNAVLWKPAPGGLNAALALQRMLVACGLDPALVTVLGTEAGEATRAMRAGVDKVVLTGSAATGRAVLHELAETLTPAVMELSGCDAVIVLDGADLGRVVDALTFALRLNGSATCMAPRRLFVTNTVADALAADLMTSLDQLDAVPVPSRTRELLLGLMDEATLYGARVLLNGLHVAPADEGCVYSTLLMDVTADMRIAQTDIFAPVLSILRVEDEEAAVAAHNACPYALTTSIFGTSTQAEALASRVHAGTVLINDIIVPTADPRAGFGGRKQSGYGVTRGREGLLAMTAPKTILKQGSRSRRAFAPTGEAHVPFFAGLAQTLHAGGWRAKIEGAQKLFRAAQQIK
jgi:aldehyde dehydrogenase (NAD+)